MKNSLKIFLEYCGALAAIILLGIVMFGHHSVSTLGSSSGFNSINLVPSAAQGDTYALAVNGTSILDLTGGINITSSTITSSGIVTTSLKVGGSSNPAFTKFSHASATYNPPSLAINATTTTTIVFTSATGIPSLNATCDAKLSTATTSIAQDWFANIDATDGTTSSGTITFQPFAAVDYATGTLNVNCLE